MTAERIHNLTRELEATRTALKAEEARNRSLTDNLLQCAEPNRVRTLAASYGHYSDTTTPRLLVLLSWLETVVFASDPLRGAPQTDTSRVDHPDNTAVESAYESMKKQRSDVLWVGAELENLIDRIRNRVAPDQTRTKERVERPRCWKRPCRGERGPINATYCPKCGKRYDQDEAEVA